MNLGLLDRGDSIRDQLGRRYGRAFCFSEGCFHHSDNHLERRYGGDVP